jgi:hypothetical protein
MSGDSVSIKLRELFDLFNSGALSQEEYDQLKSRLLQSINNSISGASNDVKISAEKLDKDSSEVQDNLRVGKGTPINEVGNSRRNEIQEEILKETRDAIPSNVTKKKKSKWKYIGIGIILLLVLGGGIWIYSNAIVGNDTGVRKVNFPIKAKASNNQMMDDILIATLNQTEFMITPEGKLSWGQNFIYSINLSPEGFIESAYLYMRTDTLLIFYSDESGGDAYPCKIEKIDLTKQHRIWKSDISGFNLGLPYIVDNFAYVTTVGEISKLNLDNGKFVYKYDDLYDREKTSFNHFDSIIFKDSLTIFLSKNYLSGRIDSVIVDEKTTKLTIKK